MGSFLKQKKMKKSKLKKTIKRLEKENEILYQKLEISMIHIDEFENIRSIDRLKSNNFRVVCQECKDRMLRDANTNIPKDTGCFDKPVTEDFAEHLVKPFQEKLKQASKEYQGKINSKQIKVIKFTEAQKESLGRIFAVFK